MKWVSGVPLVSRGSLYESPLRLGVIEFSIVQHGFRFNPLTVTFSSFQPWKKHMGIQHGDTLTINFGWCSPWWLNWRWWLRATPNEDMICVNQDWAIKYLGPLSSNGDIELAAARVARLMSERIKNFGGAQKQLQVDIYIYIWYIWYIYIYDIHIYI